MYGLERFGANQIIVMEMVEGATLEARIAHGSLAIDEARHVGIQIADALDAAHERGIVHRDLKPSNVVIRPDGNVRVLDFGLAKTLTATSLGGASMSPTVTSGPATSAGVILGTAPYMSPEQSRGLAVDRRTDIWALGCLLYECLAGRRAFEGSTLSDTLAQILTTDPDWSKLPATTPTAMSALIRRCVRKDLRQRMQSAGDVRLALEENDGNGITPAVRTSSRGAWWVFAGAAVVFAGGLALFLSTLPASRQLVPPTTVRADVVFPDQAPLWFEDGNSLAMSRDGRTIAWVGGTGSARRLWVRSVDQIGARALAGTEQASSPFFPPNGEWLGFFTPTALKKIRISGGTPQTLAPVTSRPRGAAWGEDDSIVFSSVDAPLRHLPSGADGSATIAQIPTTRPGRSPVWLPGRRVVLYEISTISSSVSSPAIAAFDLASGSEKTVIEDAAQPAVLPNGNLLFLRGDALYSVAFDADTVAPRGEPRVVVPSVQTGANSLISQYATGGGRLLYLPGQNTSAKPLTVVEWRGITGDPRLLISEPGTYRDLRYSPNGQRLAYSAWVPVEANATDLFVHDLQRDVTIRCILHRDLKPANILVTSGHGAIGQPCAKLLDFGLAKALSLAGDVTGTVEGTIAGTAAYMSPERAQGKVLDPRSDVFSFGAVLYEVLAGRRAFEGDTSVDALSAVIRDEPPALGASPLSGIVTRCLEKDLSKRYQSMAEVRAALEDAARTSTKGGASIAVLPFANLSAEKENEYFSDGLTEEITNALTHVPGLKVTARTSAFAFRGKEQDIRRIAAA